MARGCNQFHAVRPLVVTMYSTSASNSDRVDHIFFLRGFDAVSVNGVEMKTLPVNGCCKGVRGPRAVLNLLCVRRSGVLGVEMKTLPVNCWLLKRREASCDIVL